MLCLNYGKPLWKAVGYPFHTKRIGLEIVYFTKTHIDSNVKRLDDRNYQCMFVISKDTANRCVQVQ